MPGRGENGRANEDAESDWKQMLKSEHEHHSTEVEHQAIGFA